MKLEFIKQYGGVLVPASDIVAEKMAKFKSGQPYEVEIKLTRNPQFLAKVMVFFRFCFDHWDGSKVHEFISEDAQFERFRKDLTILAGFYEQTIRLDGSLRTEAKSLSFAQMEEYEFQQCYSALINAAVKHIFKGVNDERILNRLQGFF